MGILRVCLLAKASQLLQQLLKSFCLLVLLFQSLLALFNISFVFFCDVLRSLKSLVEVVPDDVVQRMTFIQLFAALIDPSLEIAESEVSPVNELIDVLFRV